MHHLWSIFFSFLDTPPTHTNLMVDKVYMVESGANVYSTKHSHWGQRSKLSKSASSVEYLATLNIINGAIWILPLRPLQWRHHLHFILYSLFYLQGAAHFAFCLRRFKKWRTNYNKLQYLLTHYYFFCCTFANDHKIKRAWCRYCITFRLRTSSSSWTSLRWAVPLVRLPYGSAA